MTATRQVRLSGEQVVSLRNTVSDGIEAYNRAKMGSKPYKRALKWFFLDRRGGARRRESQDWNLVGRDERCNGGMRRTDL